MAKKDILLIIQGGSLCAAFSFLIFLWPMPGIFAKFFSLAPIFYVGIRLGIKASCLAMVIPLLWTFAMLGIQQCLAMLLLFVPVLLVLNWHLLQSNRRYVYSVTDILHLFSSRFLYFAFVCIVALKILNIPWIEDLQANFNETVRLMRVQAPNNLFEILPGGIVFLWLLMVWSNFQVAYGIALKANVAKHKPSKKQNINLKPVWDIALVASFCLMLLNNIWIGSQFLAVFAKILIGISAFPLFIDGLETAQIIAVHNKYPRIAVRSLLIFTFILVWPMVFVVLLGLVEPWYGLKQKYLSKLR